MTSNYQSDPDAPGGISRSTAAEQAGNQTAHLAFAEDVLQAVTVSESLPDLLENCVGLMLQHLNLTSARIWMLSPAGDALELAAGKTQVPNGVVPIPRVGKHIIGRIARQQKPYFTNDLAGHADLADPEWAKRNGITAFAGHPLLLEGKLIGVMAGFSKQPFPNSILTTLANAARAIVRGILQQRSAEALARYTFQLQEKTRKLEEAQERFRLALEAAPNGIILSNQRGRITQANAQAEKMFGYAAGELLGLPFTALLPGTSDDSGSKEQSVEGWFPDADHDLIGLRKDGLEFPVEIGLNPIPTEEGTLVLTSIVDLTARKRSEDRFRLVIEAMPNGIVVINREGRIVLTNSEAERLFGYPREEMLGHPIEMLVPERYRSLHPQIRTRYFRAAMPRSMGAGRDLYGMRKDGSEFPIEIGLNPIATDDGVLVLSSIVDITERKKNEERIIEATRLKSEFLANMSHEIRTPMNVVLGMSGLLLESPLTTEQADFARTIHKGAEALLTLINDILDFSKIEAGKLDISAVDFPTQTTIEDTVELFSEVTSRKGLELTCFVAPEVPAMLRGDNSRMRQVLTNLIGNAVKFTEKGEVNVSVTVEEMRVDGVSVRFAVRDTGIGITPEAQRRLFQAFMQADGSTTRKYGGTGLGLAISRKLTELMGGRIGVDSEMGQGSTFWFVLPFERAKDTGVAEPAEAPLTGLRMLVVDDYETNRRILEKQLASWQVACDLAQDGPEALEKIRQARTGGRPYDLVLLDYGMPGMDGLEVVRTLRAEAAVVVSPILMLTSYSSRDCKEAAMGAGVTIYLTKPVRKLQLRQAIGKALGREVDSPRPTPNAATFQFPDSIGRILLVEDNPDNQRLAVIFLKRFGLECDIANNGLEAVAILSRRPYPVVLMDCQMPEMDGFEATAAIRHKERGGRHTPIIAMTAHAMQGDRQRCLDAGMDDYVSKPITPDALLAVLQRWLVSSADPVVAEPSNGRIQIRALPEIQDLIPGYLVNRSRDVVALSEALEQARLDPAGWASVCAIGHSMKGSGSGHGFPLLSQFGREIEEAARQQDEAKAQQQLLELAEYLTRLEVVYI